MFDWKCRDCLEEGKYEDLNGKETCPWCDSEELEDFRNRPVYVNVYFVERCYGGAEEGGWYYDHFEPVVSIPTDTIKERNCTYDLMKEKYSNEDREPLSSVLSVGEYRVIEERCFAKAYPEHKPIYE